MDTQSEDAKKLASICTFKQTPDWYTCDAQSFPVRFADVVMCRFASAKDAWKSLEDSWLGELVSFKHNILVREVRADGFGPPMVALSHLKGSISFVWPMTRLRLDESTDEYWELARDVTLDDMYCPFFQSGALAVFVRRVVVPSGSRREGGLRCFCQLRRLGSFHWRLGTSYEGRCEGSLLGLET